jgi:hypothetical protein
MPVTDDAWQKYVDHTVQGLAFYLDLEHKSFLSNCQQDHRNPEFLFHTLDLIGLRAPAASLAQAWRLNLPPPSLESQSRQKFSIYLVGDSSLCSVKFQAGHWVQDIGSPVPYLKEVLGSNNTLRSAALWGQSTPAVAAALERLFLKHPPASGTIKVGIALCMLNDIVGTTRRAKQRKVLETIPVETCQSIQKLGAFLKHNFDLGVMMCGGDAAIWKLDVLFNQHAASLRNLARQSDIWVLSGTSMWASLIQAKGGGEVPDDWHFRHTEDNMRHVALYLWHLVSFGSSALLPAATLATVMQKLHEATTMATVTDEQEEDSADSDVIEGNNVVFGRSVQKVSLSSSSSSCASSAPEETPNLGHSAPQGNPNRVKQSSK